MGPGDVGQGVPHCPILGTVDLGVPMSPFWGSALPHRKGCGSGGPMGVPVTPQPLSPAAPAGGAVVQSGAEHRAADVEPLVPTTPFWGSPWPHRMRCGSGGSLTTPPVPPQLCRRHKVGVLYCRAGQSTEEEMYNNESAGPAFNEFLSLLGERVTLKAFSKYAAQLDTKSERGAAGGRGGGRDPRRWRLWSSMGGYGG